VSILWEIKCHRIDIFCTYYPKNPECGTLCFSACMLPVRGDSLKSKIDINLQLKENCCLFYHDCKGHFGNAVFFQSPEKHLQ